MARSGDQADLWDGELLRRAQRSLGSEVFSEVIAQARSEPSVRVYLDVLDALTEQSETDRRRLRTEPVDYAEARQAVEYSVGSAYSLGRFRLTQDALMGLAADLETEDDPEVLERLLLAFQRPTRPNVTGTGPASGPEGRGMVLSRVQDLEVRELAVQVLGSGSPPALGSAELLVLNFEPGDERLLRRILEQAQQVNNDLLHAFCRGVRRVAEAHPTPAMLALLADTYPVQPCTSCRHEGLRLLTDRAAVPAWLRSEARLDVNPAIRALITP